MIEKIVGIYLVTAGTMLMTVGIQILSGKRP